MSIIFLCGPMAENVDVEITRKIFNLAEAELRSQGYSVENPMKNMVLHSATWSENMRIVISQMMRCEIVITLGGWRRSPDAKLLQKLAVSLFIPVFSIDDWKGR